MYAIALGASSLMVGLLTAIPALVNTLTFMPAAGFVEEGIASQSSFGRASWIALHILAFIRLCR